MIVSTLPGGRPRAGCAPTCPFRIGSLTDLPVTHVVAMSMAKRLPQAEAVQRKERDTLGMLNVMAYGGSKRPVGP